LIKRCDGFESELFARVTMLLQTGSASTRVFGFQAICLPPPNATAFVELITQDKRFEYNCPTVFQSGYFSIENSLSDVFHDFVVFFYYSVSVMTTSGNGFVQLHLCLLSLLFVCL
jgi:hypothetical protein